MLARPGRLDDFQLVEQRLAEPAGALVGLLDDYRMVGRLRIAEARLLLHVDAHAFRRRRQMHLRVIDDRVLLQAGGDPQRHVRRANQADRRAAVRHAVLRGRDAGNVVGRAHRAAGGAARISHRPRAADHALAANLLVVGSLQHAAFLDGFARNLQILVAQADDRQDRAAAVGLDDRVDARIEPRADQRLDAGQCQFLELGIRQVDHLRDEVAGHHLVEVLGRELHRNGVVRQECLGTRQCRADFQRGVQFQPRPGRNVGQLQPVDGPLRKLLPRRAELRFRVEHARGTHVPGHLHPFRADKGNLRSRADVRHGRLIHHHAGARAANARTGLHEPLGRRQVLAARTFAAHKGHGNDH